MIANHVATPRGSARRRRGLTLLEILISILIMGVGLLSLATLFPLGLLRLREANRSTRSVLLAESASSDLVATTLTYKPYYKWIYGTYYGTSIDPFVTEMAWANPSTGNPPWTKSFDRSSGGWPVVIDPLWIYEVEQKMIAAGNNAQALALRFDAPGVPSETRFGLGLGWLSSASNAYGLRRISPYNPGLTNPEIERRLASIDDLVYQSQGELGAASGEGSPLVPVMVASAGGPAVVTDLSYSYLFTGKQSDMGNSMTFDGDVVVCHNRAFEFDATTLPGRTQSVAGEMTVQAIWGYGPPVQLTPGSAYYSLNNTTVSLRWPATQPDLQLVIGSWICDATYSNDPFYFTAASRYPGQRCNWYRVIRKSDVRFDATSGYNELIVTVDRPLRAQTPLVAGMTPAQPLGVEPAVIMPSVVNVIPKVFTIQMTD